MSVNNEARKAVAAEVIPWNDETQSGAPPEQAQAATRKHSDIRKEKTRQAILMAARRVFSRQGYEAANVSDIVARIKMAQGTFYYHFPTKKAVLLEILREFFDRMKLLVSEWASTTDASAEAADRFAESITRLLHENRELAGILMRERNNPDPDISGFIKDFYSYLYDRTAAGLELGIAMGLVRPLDARVAAVALIGMVEKVACEMATRSDSYDIETVMREMIALQNNGIRPH